MYIDDGVTEEQIKSDFALSFGLNVFTAAFRELADELHEDNQRFREGRQISRQKALQFIEDYHREMGTPVPAYHYLSFEQKHTVDFNRFNARREKKGLEPFTLQEYIDDYERRVGVRLSVNSFA